MTRELRPYQADAYAAVRDEWAAGRLRTAIVHATGLGKGDLIGKMCVDEAAAGGDVLVLAHRDEILRQLGDRCRAYDPGARVGRVQAERTERQHRITAASIQTVAARVRKMDGADEMTRRRLERKIPRQPTLVLVDEAHRACSDSYLSTLRHYGVLDDQVRTCGFTATFVRGDRRGLGDVFQSVADRKGIKWAVEHGHLVRPRGKVVVADHVDLNAAKVNRGDYQDADLGEMVAQDVDQIVKSWCEYAHERLTIAFVPTVASGEDLREAFRRMGVAADLVTGATPTHERQRMYADLAAGRIRVLVNVFVLVEGWDCPPVSCVLWARPTRLPGVYQQGLGRGLRQAPGKTDCLVLDVVGASRTQRLVTLVDLVESAEYDRREVDALPCEVCGLPTRQAEVGEPTCSCAAEPGERDPDGGRRKLIGPAVYEDLDLIMQQSSCVWLRTPGGTPMLPAGRRTAIVCHDPESDLYQPGHIANRGRLDPVALSGEWLSLSEATSIAERWAMTAEPSIAARDASWRKRGGAPSPAQLEQARRLRIPGAEQMNKNRLSDEISIAITSERLLT